MITLKRRAKRNLLNALSLLCLVAAAALGLYTILVPPPALDLGAESNSTHKSESTPIASRQDLDVSWDLLNNRLQGPSPPPVAIEPVVQSQPESPPPPPPPAPPDFRLTSIYSGNSTTIATFVNGAGESMSGTNGETVFGATILTIDPITSRVKVQHLGHEHWLGLK